MQRIDGPTRSATLPAPAATGTGSSAPGYFGHGDPLTSTPPTTMDVDWANMVQEELIAVVVGGGLTPSKTDHTQVFAAIEAIVAGAVATAESAPTYVPGNPGYRISADGYIEMWGVVSTAITSRSNRTVTFPNGGFPNACDGIEMHPINSAAATPGGTTTMQEVSLSTTGAVVRAQNEDATIGDCGGGFRWKAWGH